MASAIVTYVFWRAARAETYLRLSGRRGPTETNPIVARTRQGGLNYFVAGEEGQDHSIVLIHGFGANSYTWRYLIPELDPKQSTIYAIDLKGCGQSPKPQDGKYSIEDQARLVTRFILRRRLHCKHLQIVGHSMGGGVALMTALALTERRRKRPIAPIGRLVLVDTIAFSQALPWFVAVLRVPILGRLIGQLLPVSFQVRATLRLIIADRSFVTEDMVDAYADGIRQPGGRSALAAIAREIIPNDTSDLEQRYGRLDWETLLIWGRDDRIVPLAVGEKLQRALPNAKLRTIDFCGHLPQEEAPEEFTPIVANFLQPRSAKRKATSSRSTTRTTNQSQPSSAP